MKGRGRREEAFASESGNDPSLVTSAPANSRAFTLLELLVVISILGLLAALTVPVLKNFSKSDAGISGARQLLDGVGRARQLAMSQRTTVYMVFVPTNYWIDASGQFPNAAPGSWWGNLLQNQLKDVQTAVTNLADKQLSGFNFVAYGAMGDQPGRHAWHYLDRWQDLPEGTFIAFQKFVLPPTNYYTITDPIYPRFFYNVYGFHTTNAIPFPSGKGTNVHDYPLPRITVGINLPYVAFNYLGQLTFDGQNMADRDEYLPLAQGSVMPMTLPGTKVPLLSEAPPVPHSPDVQESPPGNSTNISYNIIHIDHLTGRAVLEYHKMR
jgi:prepilin-type N-terminal cleavage/methylation domain-containing protein